MLVIYKKDTQEIVMPEQTSYSAQKVLERQHIEKWIENNPQILGEELHILTTEYDKFDKTNERLDLLAIDRNGVLVVIELKRDDSGKDVDIQAIKYAAYCSTLTLNEVVEIHKDYLIKQKKKKTSEEVRDIVLSFVQGDFEQIGDKPRIIIVSSNYRPEVTASVMWLRKFGIDFKCIRLIPYQIDSNTLGLEAVTIIPIPEAEEYMIKVEKKENQETNLSITQQEYIRFYSDLVKRLGTNKSDLALVEPRPQSYYQIFIKGVATGIHFEWGFHGRPRNSFGAELHFEKANKSENAALLTDIVAKCRNDLEAKVGEKLIVQVDWGKTWSRMYFEKNHGNMTEELKDWAIKVMSIMIDTVCPYLKKK